MSSKQHLPNLGKIEKSRENSRLKRRCLSDVVEEYYRAVLLTIRTRRQEVRVVM